MVVNRMAESGFTRFPVLDPNGDAKIVGMVGLSDRCTPGRATSKTSAPARECCGFVCRWTREESA